MAWGNLGAGNLREWGQTHTLGKFLQGPRRQSLDQPLWEGNHEPREEKVWTQYPTESQGPSHARPFSCLDLSLPSVKWDDNQEPFHLSLFDNSIPFYPGRQDTSETLWIWITIVLMRTCPEHNIPLSTGSMSVLKTCKQEYLPGPALTVNKSWTQTWRRENTQA